MGENEEFEQQEENIGYKIVAGKEYTIKRQEYNGSVFYKIPVYKTHQDNTTQEGLKNVRFEGGADLIDKTRIKIISAFEDFYQKDKFNTIFTLVIRKYEITSQPEEVINQAYNEFNSADNSFDLPF